MRNLYLAISILVLLPVTVSAQTNWVTFSPPDKSFRVDVPRKPIHQYYFLDYEKDGLFEGNTRVDTYDFSTSDSGTGAMISVFHLPRPRARRQFDKECDSIMLIVGGDNKEIINRTSVTINGRHAREYLYRNGDIQGRVLIVNAGTRIFFLQYHAEAGVLPELVDRIFGSFALELT